MSNLSDSIVVELTVGEVIAIYRAAKDISQAELAQRVGVSRNYISTIERNKNIDQVSWGLVKRILNELGFKIRIVAKDDND